MKLKNLNKQIDMIKINERIEEYTKSIGPEKKRIHEAGRTNRERNQQKRFSRKMRGI
jgi:hypothetical protein